MIERKILAIKVREKEIQEFVFSFVGRLASSKVKLQRTPLGEKISVYTSRPGMVVGRRGANIREMTSILKTKYGLENPQIEVVEIEKPALNAAAVAKSLVSLFERFGPKRFKSMSYRAVEESMKAGARGVEIVVAGRGLPGERAKTWRFSDGYLKKSGDISVSYVDRWHESSRLKSGSIGVKVSILKPDVVLPDEIKIHAEEEMKKGPVVEVVKDSEAELIKQVNEEKKEVVEKKEEDIKSEEKNKDVVKKVKKKVKKKIIKKEQDVKEN